LQRYLLMNGLLGVICLALAAILYKQLTADLVPPVTDASKSSSATTGEAVGSGALTGFPEAEADGPAAFAAISERPLFTPSRRPAEAGVSPATEPEATPLPAFVLRGVVHSGKVRRALLETAENAPLLRLREGETLDGWEIVTILPRKMVLRQGEQSLEVPISPPQPATP
jgi:general secretion pathway protein N